MSPKYETKMSYKVWGYHRENVEDASLQGCYDMLSGTYVLIDMA